MPGKVLADLVGAPMILRQLERIGQARTIDGVVVATSDHASDDDLANLVRGAGHRVVRGSLEDLLDRFALAAQQSDAQHIVRLTADCPLIDPDVIDVVVAHHLVAGADITTNALAPTFPDGLDVEVVRRPILLTAAKEADTPWEREHVTQFIYRRQDRFRVRHYNAPADFSDLRWTVDEPEDITFVRAVFEELYPANPRFGMHDVLDLLRRRPDLTKINARFLRNEGLAASIAAAAAMNSSKG